MQNSTQTRLQMRFGNKNSLGGNLGSLLHSSSAFNPTSILSDFSHVIDPSGRLNFANKAVLHAQGVDFSNGSSYHIKLQDMEPLGELGRGQYGTVQKVLHQPTGVMMAMKEIRIELDQHTLNQILMELNILHRSTSPFIVEFYGAFFVENCVCYCMEYMDAGSMDKLYGDGVPESILAKITLSVVQGLKSLKQELSVIHRDVKPTNILVNLKGDIKLCDFGVSGQLVQSLAKTNVGCQSYMAPERIHHAFPHEPTLTYTASSDVWSLGLSLVEMALGYYPFPNTQFDSVFAQLDAIVSGEPPELDSTRYSPLACSFVKSCLKKQPSSRPTYAEMLEHPWLVPYLHQDHQDVAAWAQEALYRASAAKFD